jgi:naphthalene 1,2-dioxygenase system ferredoxin subunit
MNWTDLCSDGALEEGGAIAVAVGAREIALFRVDGHVYATDNQCTHEEARLCDGFLLDHEIECPLHQARFDVRDGRATCEPAVEPLRTWPVRIESGRIWVDLNGA